MHLENTTVIFETDSFPQQLKMSLC